MSAAVTIHLLGEPVGGVIYKITHRASGAGYIGMTRQKDARARWRCHVCEAKAGRSTLALHRAIRKYGAAAFLFEVIAVGRTVEHLRQLERSLIASHKTHARDGGYNLTGGGDGAYDASAETRERMRNARKALWQNPEFAERIASSQRGRKATPEAVAKRVARATGRPLSAAHKAKLSKLAAGRQISADQRTKISQSLAGRKADPEAVAKRAAALRGRTRPQETVQKIAAANKGRVVSVEQRQRHSAVMKGRKPSDETRAKLSEAQKLRWARAREGRA